MDDARPPIVTLTTDFGLRDSYVAAMKGVLLSINPRVQIVDVSHEIRPQAIKQAVFVTQSAWPYFPSWAIHVAVVDPGVGTARRAMALRTTAGMFVGPDNGVLSAAFSCDDRESIAGHQVRLPEGCRAASITNRHYLLEPVSATFHGRDVFAAAAAHLASGVQIEQLGEPVEEVVALRPLRAARGPDGELSGDVIHIDTFGNVITDILASDAGSQHAVLEIGGRRVHGPVRTYAEADGLGWLGGSHGYVEAALTNGNAARELPAEVGMAAVLRTVTGRG